MSGNEPPDDNDPGKKPHLRLVGAPSNIAKPHPTPEQTKQLYMASPHIEWTPFAKSLGWSPTSSRKDLPVDEWTKAKRDIIAREQAENIAEATFNHKSRWHQDVLRTMEEHPQVHDAMMGVLRRRLGDIIAMIQDDDKRELEHRRANLPMQDFKRGFDDVSNKDLAMLTRALGMSTQAKHKSLLINDWSFKVAESFSDPKQFSKEQEKVDFQTWEISLLGGEKTSIRDMQKTMAQWYDKPKMPHTPEQIAPSQADE